MKGNPQRKPEQSSPDKRRESCFNDFKMKLNGLQTVINTLTQTARLLHLQQDDHGEEHVETGQTGIVHVIIGEDQVRGHVRQPLKPYVVTCMYEDSGINHSDCGAGRKAIFGTTPSPVSSLSSWYVFRPVAKVNSLFFWQRNASS